jgi:serine protease Do
MRSLPRIVAESAIGKPLDITIMREGEEINLTVTLGVLEEAEEAGLFAGTPNDISPNGPLKLAEMGMTLNNLNPDLRQEFAIGDDVEGVIITEVEPGMPADESGLMAGDVIRRVGKVQVENLAEADNAVQAEIEADKTSILLLINRQGRDRFTAVTIK